MGVGASELESERERERERERQHFRSKPRLTVDLLRPRSLKRDSQPLSNLNRSAKSVNHREAEVLH